MIVLQVQGFKTPADVDQWLDSNPMSCPGALHFVVRDANVISYGVQTNSTDLPKRKQSEDATFKFQILLQIAAEREISRHLIGGMYWVLFLVSLSCIASLFSRRELRI